MRKKHMVSVICEINNEKDNKISTNFQDRRKIETMESLQYI